MRFLRPEFIHWWQVLPVLVAVSALHYLYTHAVRRDRPIAPRFVRLSRRSTWLREVVVLSVSLLAAGGLLLALVRPQALVSRRTPEFDRQDLILVLDQSASMRARDIVPSRFARATAEIRNFLHHKPEMIDRVGLVGFADAALVLSYLTGDVDSVSFYLDWIDDDPDTRMGTNFGAALTSAMEVARKDTRSTRKLFLLLSDGEDYGAELNKALTAFRAAGYRIHCIGIGSEQEVPIPIAQLDGQEGLLRDDAGQLVKTTFAESTLREIARTTGGRYVRSTTGGELAQAIADLATSERRIRGWRTVTEYHDVYPMSLAVAAAAGAVLWLLL